MISTDAATLEGRFCATDAEQMLSVDHDNAEVDGLEGLQPNWVLMNTDKDYRRRYVAGLLELVAESVAMSGPVCAGCPENPNNYSDDIPF